MWPCSQHRQRRSWSSCRMVCFPCFKNVRRDTVLPRCLATDRTVDGYAELFQCRRVVKLIYDWQPRQGIEGSVCDDVLGWVELEIMLHQTLQLHALISDDLASLWFERGCFDASRAGGSFHALIHPLRGLLGLAPSCSKGVACAWGRVLLVSQHRFPLDLRDWLHFFPASLETVSILACFLAECSHGWVVDDITEVRPFGIGVVGCLLRSKFLLEAVDSDCCKGLCLTRVESEDSDRHASSFVWKKRVTTVSKAARFSIRWWFGYIHFCASLKFHNFYLVVWSNI